MPNYLEQVKTERQQRQDAEDKAEALRRVQADKDAEEKRKAAIAQVEEERRLAKIAANNTRILNDAYSEWEGTIQFFVEQFIRVRQLGGNPLAMMDRFSYILFTADKRTKMDWNGVLAPTTSRLAGTPLSTPKKIEVIFQ